MSNLQVALDELTTEVASLDRQKTDLIREIVALKSKNTFLKQTTIKLEKAKTDAQIHYDLRFTELQAQEAELEEKIAIALEDLDALIQQKQLAESELETLEQQHEQEIIGHNNRLTSVKNEVKAVEVLKNDVAKLVVEQNKQISIKQAKFEKLELTLRQAELNAESKIYDIDQGVETAKLKLNEINQRIDQKVEQYDELEVKITQQQAKLDVITAKHEEFLVYEKRADKALKARESALLQGEASLANQRRRGGVLDNI